MKKIIILLFITVGSAVAQQTVEFHRKSYVTWRPGVGVAGGAGYVQAAYVNNPNLANPLLLQRLVITPVAGPTPKYVGTVGSPAAAGSQPIALSELLGSQTYAGPVALQYAGATTLYGDIRQSRDTIYFYVWPFTGAGLTAAQTAANTIFTADVFFMRIPARTVVSMPYRSFQLGAITLPAKVYVSSKIQLNDNTAFDVNIAGMIGYRWGRNKYYNLPNEKEGGSYVRAWSINYFLGITKVEVNSKNTTNEIADTHTLAAPTTGFALGYHYNRLGVFVAFGFDIPFGNNSQEWVFNGNPWVGIGLGIKLD